MKDKKDKNIRIDYKLWSFVRVKSVELTLKTGRTISIKQYIEKAVKEKLDSTPDEI